MPTALLRKPTPVRLLAILIRPLLEQQKKHRRQLEVLASHHPSLERSLHLQAPPRIVTMKPQAHRRIPLEAQLMIQQLLMPPPLRLVERQPQWGGQLLPPVARRRLAAAQAPLQKVLPTPLVTTRLPTPSSQELPLQALQSPLQRVQEVLQRAPANPFPTVQLLHHHLLLLEEPPNLALAALLEPLAKHRLCPLPRLAL